jgi:hypothetical protein
MLAQHHIWTLRRICSSFIDTLECLYAYCPCYDLGHMIDERGVCQGWLSLHQPARIARINAADRHEHSIADKTYFLEKYVVFPLDLGTRSEPDSQYGHCTRQIAGRVGYELVNQGEIFTIHICIIFIYPRTRSCAIRISFSMCPGKTFSSMTFIAATI